MGKSIQKENEDIRVLTEIGFLIETEEDCYDEMHIKCMDICRKTVDSGIFVITNTCITPITITGLRNTDPVRFSLFDFDSYSGTEIYHTGNTVELPMTINSYEKKTINTFFHPLVTEIINGNEGTVLNRTGDRFGAYIDIYPGFPMLNCSEKGKCDTFITLTGELLRESDEPADRSWMDDCDNYQGSTAYTFPVVVPQICIGFSESYGKLTSAGIMETIGQECERLISSLKGEPSWDNKKYSKWTAALEFFKEFSSSQTSVSNLGKRSYGPISVVADVLKQSKVSASVIAFDEDDDGNEISNKILVALPSEVDDTYNGANLTFDGFPDDLYEVADYDYQEVEDPDNPDPDALPNVRKVITLIDPETKASKDAPDGVGFGSTFIIAAPEGREIITDLSFTAKIEGNTDEYVFNRSGETYNKATGYLIQLDASSDIKSQYSVDNVIIYVMQNSTGDRVKIRVADNYNPSDYDFCEYPVY